MYYETLESILEKYSTLFVDKTVQPKELIITQDKIPNNIFWVKSGTVKAFKVNGNGQEFLIGLFGPGEFLGEMEFFYKSNYFASVEAITDCELVSISFNNFQKIISQENEFLQTITSKLAQRLVNISERTSSCIFFPLEYLVATYLFNEYKSKGSLQLKINKNNFANYFGTNIRSINRILKNLNDQKIIETVNDELEIKSINKIIEVIKNYN